MHGDCCVYLGDKSHRFNAFNLRSELISFYTPYRGLTVIK